MRILYIDIDSLRPDHLGCYGYRRKTSPNIDRIARQGVMFRNLFVSDAPCLPSRTSLFSGRFGIHTGVINHGGVASEPFVEGPGRGFESTLGQTSWMACLRKLGMKTATISSFGERHSAWHWYANFNEVYNTGKRGMDSAEEVSPLAIDWIRRNAKQENWFLHVNLWDPHTPYRAPAEAGEPFANDPLPAWYTEQVRQQHWNMCGPHGAQEINGYEPSKTTYDGDYPRQPIVADSMDAARKMFDGYDTGVWWADHHVGLILKALEAEGILDETAVIVTSDHGENLGELNIYGDHQTADYITSRVPLIVHWPGVTDKQAGRVDRGQYYHVDFAATMIELLGGKVPENWDGVSFASEFRVGEAGGRDYLVVSQGAWCLQRSAVFRSEGKQYMCIRTFHGAFHGFPDVMLFNTTDDPHQLKNLANQRMGLVEEAMRILDDWHGQMMRSSTHPVDPMWTVWNEGGPLHCRGELPAYLKRLRATGRARWADLLATRFPQFAKG